MKKLGKIAAGLALISLAPACEQENNITHCPAPGSIRGHVCNKATGDFVPNATITITPKTSMGSCLTIVSVNADDYGYYQLENVRAAEYTITYTTEDGFKDEREVTFTENTDTKVEWPECSVPMATVKGRLCDKRTGMWVNGGEVYVKAKASKWSTITDPDGNFTLDIPAGEQTLWVENKDYKKSYDITTEADAEFSIEETCEPVGHGEVSGRICSFYEPAATPESETRGYFPYGTKVFVEMGNFYTSAITDNKGNFKLTGVPEGEAIKVQAVKNRFATDFNVKIVDQQETKLDQPQCLDTSNIQIAVVTGLYDRSDFILNSIGFTTYRDYTKLEEERNVAPIENENGNITYIPGTTRYFQDHFLSQLDWIEEFDIIYFNSGSYEYFAGADPSIHGNLKLFLEQGGSLFVSERANEILRVVMPQYVSFVGNGEKDAANKGMSVTETQTATLKSPALIGALDKDQITVNYINDSWPVMNATQPSSTEILVSGDVKTNSGSLNDAALVVSFEPEKGGKVIFSSIATNKERNTTDDVKNLMKYLFFEL